MDMNRNEGGEKQGSPISEGSLLSFDLQGDFNTLQIPS